MKYSTIIFDLDGTIVNTEPLWRAATKQLLNNRDVVVTPVMQDAIDRKVRGLPLIECCLIIKGMFNLSDAVEVLMQEELDAVRALYEKHISFVDGFVAFHDRIKKQGMKSAIASNCKDDIILQAVRSLGLDQFFGQHIYGVSHVNHVAKPKPDIFLHAARILESLPSECIVIEDSRSGIRAAKAAGMKCVAINTSGMRDLLAEADVIVDTFAQIDFVAF